MNASMKKLLSAIVALWAVAGTGPVSGVAHAEEPSQDGAQVGAEVSSGGTATTVEGTPPRGYGLGGAQVKGIPYDEYIRMTGEQWFPGLQRQKIDYPAGQIQGRTLEQLFPGIGEWDRRNADVGLDGPTIGESVIEGAENVGGEAALRQRFEKLMDRLAHDGNPAGGPMGHTPCVCS